LRVVADVANVNMQDLVNYLLQFKGTPYVWGGNDLSKGVDCSGLIQQGFKHFGIDLPRTTYDQIGQGKAISASGLRVGDLVFFDTDPSTAGPDHVGIYLGNGKMLHAPRTGKPVQVTDMTSGYYMDRFMGGRRIDGTYTTGATVDDLAKPDDQVKLSPEELASNYGWSYAFLKSQPEVSKVFDEAVRGSWTADKFQAALRDTNWFKTTSSTARQAEVQKKTDPATWAASMTAAKLQVQQLASQIGAAIPSGQLDKIAASVIATGLQEDGLRNVLGQYVNFTKNGTLTGEAGMHEYTMKQFAYNNGVSISDQAIKNQAQLVVRKLATTQDFESQVRRQAISAFPGYADQLNAGQNMKDIASPYIQTMSSEWGIPSSGITLQDPTIKGALNGLNQEGKPTGKTLLDFTTQLRNDPRWNSTQGAQNQAMTVGRKVLSDMGLT
jgi:hypothetical protein